MDIIIIDRTIELIMIGFGVISVGLKQFNAIPVNGIGFNITFVLIRFINTERK